MTKRLNGWLLIPGGLSLHLPLEGNAEWENMSTGVNFDYWGALAMSDPHGLMDKFNPLVLIHFWKLPFETTIFIRSICRFLHFPHPLSDIVIESGIINEFVEEAWPSAESGNLLPPLSNPLKRSTARIWVDFVGKKLIPPFYRILQRQEESGQIEAANELVEGLRTFVQEMDSEGPFFLGPQLGLVDISYIPWALRFYVLKAYRDFEVPKEGPEWIRFDKWFEACRQHPSVKATLADEDKLLASYERYAKNNAGSLVADAINANKPLP